MRAGEVLVIPSHLQHLDAGGKPSMIWVFQTPNAQRHPFPDGTRHVDRVSGEGGSSKRLAASDDVPEYFFLDSLKMCIFKRDRATCGPGWVDV